MAEIDAELLERVARWCADAGRQAGTREIRAALSPLSWDELLAARAILADPPPMKPLGPHALADMARGTPADAAAEREREARYPREEMDEPVSSLAPADAPPSRGKGAGRGRGRKAKTAAIVVHRARDRVVAPPEPPPEPPSLDDLRRDEGRAVLERFLRRHGGRRASIVAELRAGWRGPDGAAPTEADLAALLDLHGLARAFERREHDELLHALRATGGSRAAAAGRLGLDEAGLEASLARLGATEEAERIRGERRSDLRARATLSERVHLLLAQEERLRDLGLLEEFEADLRARLPEHLRALRAGREPLAPALSRSLSLPFDALATLAARLRLDLGRFDARASGDASPANRGVGAPRREFRPAGGARKPKPGAFDERRRDGAGRSRGGTDRGDKERAGRRERPGGSTRPERAGGPARPMSTASRRPGEAPARGVPPRPGAARFTAGRDLRGGPAPGGGTGSAPRGGPGTRSGPAPRSGPGPRTDIGARSRPGTRGGPPPRTGQRRAGPPGSRAGGGKPRGAGPGSRGPARPPRRRG